MNAVVRAVRALTADSVAALAEQIGALRAEERAAFDEAAQREAAAMRTDTFAEAERLQRQAREASWRAERAAARLPELEARHAAAIAKERTAIEARLIARHRSTYAEYCGVLRELARLQLALIETNHQARTGLGDLRASAVAPIVHFIGVARPDTVAAWIERHDRDLLREVTPRQPAKPKPAKPVAVAPAPKPGPGRMQHAVGLADEPPPVAPPPPAADDLSPLRPDHVRILVIRAGYPDSDGVASHGGRRFQMPREKALMAARNGAIEIIEDPTKGVEQ